MTTIMTMNVLGKTLRCDAKCHKAKHKKCTCICLGKYHNIGTDTAIHNRTIDLLKETSLILQSTMQLAFTFTIPQHEPKPPIINVD